jgi:anti-sigma regulatory factor (Ser/Thr protein kinase)
MLELALHILDIAENSVRAGARTVRISLDEQDRADRLTLKVTDDGAGMSEAVLQQALDPFYTSKKVRRVGLGLPMLAEAAQRAGGRFEIDSREGVGTRLTVSFQLSHLDRQPLGDLEGALTTLVAGNAGIDFVYRHRCGKRIFTLDTRRIRRQIGEIPLNHPEVIRFVRQYVREGLSGIGTKA